MIANAARHGGYGINGQYFSYGNEIISGYYPDAVFASNYLAGASAARYPSGTLVVSPFENQFANITAGDYTVRADSVLKGAAPDGSDVGANFPELMAAMEGVQAGVGPLTPEDDPTPVPPAVDFSADCRFLECTFTDASIAGTAPLVAAAWSFGDSATSSGSAATHAFAAAGSYVVTLTVTDVNGLSASASTTVTVAPPNLAPAAAFVASCADLLCSFADRSTDADGTIAAWTWNFGAGTASGAVFAVI